jgi:serine/threonine protein kinase
MIPPDTHEIASGLGRHRADGAASTEPIEPANTLDSDLRQDHSALLDFAYDEYCRAVDRGDAVDQQAFAAQFPEIEQSLLNLLEVHSFVVGNSLLTAVEPDIHWPTPGEVFLGFELLEEIGQGAFSRVFLAREVDLGNRQVVVKVSQKGTTEATTLGALDHPNIIPVHSITADRAVNLTALCMPYLGRTTAAEWIQTRFKAASARRVKSQRHLQSVIDIGIGVCLGLSFAHSRQVLHCDIKPSNILITHDGEPLLLDFNLSTHRTQEIHRLGGTLMYMAPEQILLAGGDRNATISESTDVFCLGATLYHMATGRLPFPLSGTSKPRLKDVMDDALALRQGFDQASHPLPDPLLKALRHALAFDPDDRISSANELRERLLACQKQPLHPRFHSVGILAVAGAIGLGLWSLSLVNGKSSTPEPSPLAISPPETTEASPLESARRAERDGRYAEARQTYRAILTGELEVQNVTQDTRESLIHSLAFCQMMDGQLIDARTTFSELKDRGFTNEVLARNRTACLVLIALTSDGDKHRQSYLDAKLALRHYMEFQGERVEHLHALAIMDAMLSNLEEEKNRAAALGNSLVWVKRGLRFDLSKRKALAIGYLVPAANDREPLGQILKDDPGLEPDVTVILPVESPVSGVSTTVSANLP